MPQGIKVSRSVFERMLAESRRNQAEECCGLLAGRNGIISDIYPGTNVLASATAYEIAPAEIFSILKGTRAAELDLLGIYHSHPNTDNAPSQTDIDRAYYPDTAYFIISPRPDAQEPVRAFRIQEGHATELSVELIT
jgi:proteasome lid subunit RPN8/RPN11